MTMLDHSSADTLLEDLVRGQGGIYRFRDADDPVSVSPAWWQHRPASYAHGELRLHIFPRNHLCVFTLVDIHSMDADGRPELGIALHPAGGGLWQGDLADWILARCAGAVCIGRIDAGDYRTNPDASLRTQLSNNLRSVFA